MPAASRSVITSSATRSSRRQARIASSWACTIVGRCPRCRARVPRGAPGRTTATARSSRASAHRSSHAAPPGSSTSPAAGVQRQRRDRAAPSPSRSDLEHTRGQQVVDHGHDVSGDPRRSAPNRSASSVDQIGPATRCRERVPDRDPGAGQRHRLGSTVPQHHDAEVARHATAPPARGRSAVVRRSGGAVRQPARRQTQGSSTPVEPAGRALGARPRRAADRDAPDRRAREPSARRPAFHGSSFDMIETSPGWA